MVLSVASKCVGAEKAFQKLVNSFPRDFQTVWDSRHTTPKLLALASRVGCEELINAVAKGATAEGEGLSLRQMSFEKALDKLGGVDVTIKVDNKVIGIDITTDDGAYIEKRRKLLFKWNEGRKKLLKALKFHHVIVVVWEVNSWSELTESQKGELAEALLIHIENQEGKDSFCSQLILE